MKIGLRTLTPIWTGGVDMRCDRIHETGIIGSLRWWYEALVRGLGGYACDPRGGIGCPDKEGNRCPVCELFGCTGWSRKFRLRVLNNTGQPLNKPLDSNEEFIVDLIELKPLNDVEKWLINKTFWLICNYGSMGGRTVLKPQRSKRIGRDYGLVKIESLDINSESSKNEVKKRLQTLKIGNNHKDWPNLKYFFFVKNNFLWRKQMNELMGLTPKGRPQPRRTELEQFLGSIETGVSKKIFSFQKPARLWGYTKSEEMLGTAIERLKQFGITNVIRGSEVI